MKTILLSAVFIIPVYVGFVFSKKYVKKSNFYNGLMGFCNSAINEINFCHTRLKELIDNNMSIANVEYKKFLILYKSYLTEGKGRETFGNEIRENFNYLTNDEIDKIVSFFCNLGNRDVDSELSNINNYLSTFDTYNKVAEENKKKYSPMYIKLGILFGVAVVVVLI